MPREQLLKEIANAEIIIETTRESTIFSDEYKQTWIAAQERHIAQCREEIKGYDRTVSQLEGRRK